MSGIGNSANSGLLKGRMKALSNKATSGVTCGVTCGAAIKLKGHIQKEIG